MSDINLSKNIKHEELHEKTQNHENDLKEKIDSQEQSHKKRIEQIDEITEMQKEATRKIKNIQDMVVKKNQENEKLIRSRRITSYLYLIFALCLSIASLTAILIKDIQYIDKTKIQEDLSTIISNDGDLRAIKTSFETQEKISGISLLLASESSYYNSNIALSSVLDDLRVKAFMTSDKSLLPKLEPLVREHEEINPFDKLYIGQKDYFENIRIKSGDNYQLITNDITNLVDELYQQNTLVNEYLSDSKMSYWISIFAVALSLFIGGYQIFTSRPEAMKKIYIELFSELLDKSDKESDSKPT